MSETILQLCVISVFCGVIMSLMPDGGCKTVGKMLCTCILIASVIKPLTDFDFETYALESAKLKEVEAAFADGVMESSERLQYMVIHEEYQEYILSKALLLGIDNPDVELELSWNNDGLWVPCSCKLSGEYTNEQKRKLSNILSADLGIPEERQFWISE